MQDNQLLDRKGNVIEIGHVLVVRGLRYKVLAVDHLQGSGSVQLECLSPVEAGFERRWESRYWLCRGYEIE